MHVITICEECIDKLLKHGEQGEQSIIDMFPCVKRLKK